LFACQFIISNQLSLLYYPFAVSPPSFLLPFPLLLSYPLVASLSLLLVLSSLHSLSSLQLLLLRAVLVLAPADGAAWVQAALVRDLVLRTNANANANAPSQCCSPVRLKRSFLGLPGFLFDARAAASR